MFEMEFLLAVILVYGITNIIVRGSIFDGVKETVTDWHINATEGSSWKWSTGKFVSLTNCPMCTGFWVGMLVGALYGPYEPWNVIFNGAIYSGTCWILHCITQFLGQGDEPERTVTVYIHPESKMTLEDTPFDVDEEETERIVLNG